MLMQFVIGPRQVGKTTGVESILERIRMPVHYVLVEDEPTHNRNWLKEQWWYAQSLGAESLLVVDEIQKIEGWAETLKFLWDDTRKKKKRLKCIFLGSSSLDLTQGTQESLAGRFEVLHIPHWDYLTSRKLVHGLSMEEFLKVGGYPGSYQFLKDPARWRNYLRSSVIESVLTKDIFKLKTIKKPALFRQLVELLASYPAQEISFTKLLGQLQESGNVEIVKHYMTLLKEAFLFYGLEKFSPKKVLQKASSPKIIPMCPALIEALSPQINEGRRFEAYVGSQLIHMQGEVYYWREGLFEVDFVFRNERGKLFAIEVKWGKKKHSASLTKFLEKTKNVEPIVIDKKNVNKLQEFLTS